MTQQPDRTESALHAAAQESQSATTSINEDDQFDTARIHALVRKGVAASNMDQQAATAPAQRSDQQAADTPSGAHSAVSAKVPLSDLDAALSALEASLSPPVANPVTSSCAIWLPDRALALVTVPKGTLLTRMGRRDKSDLYLWPEEAMFLVARGDLLVDEVDGVDQCFETMIIATQSTDRYTAYCELKQSEYIVARGVRIPDATISHTRHKHECAGRVACCGAHEGPTTARSRGRASHAVSRALYLPTHHGARFSVAHACAVATVDHAAARPDPGRI
ncbi:hypothetical protein AMAG_09951 [Allomyces macrogynus ATCC 38327]|uniref:tRNA-splicing endonuclease subunit Sen54 N-terminal domain-containing protein n=1 Tax=Allomyces macrogynus (strain ATCC 38327) TaxID=578462 RepID=A0A0L0SQE4_ALLM3|nr:hypothetical protein AMAG_09951 [Allomyces macrogynus ATCC 38327]|eukprot:KNE64594.1 hypothetical protein AMAG_09951 [Allomyces macrogynus ATCC 38327]